MIKKLFFIGPFLLSMACFLVAGFFVWQRYMPLPAQASVESPDLTVQSFSVPELNIHTAVYPGEITGTQWSYSSRGVSYLSSSPLPGHPGNSILYGHNWPNLLSPLSRIKPGMEIVIGFSDQTFKTFIVTAKATVLPTQADILAPTADIRVTVFTCTGFLDSKRLVITAIPR